jgi:hypothetical protein
MRYIALVANADMQSSGWWQQLETKGDAAGAFTGPNDFEDDSSPIDGPYTFSDFSTFRPTVSLRHMQ